MIYINNNIMKYVYAVTLKKKILFACTVTCFLPTAFTLIMYSYKILLVQVLLLESYEV